MPAGSYKLYTQTNTPAYPDQWFGGSSIGAATAITVSGATTQDITLVSPPVVSLSGIVKTSGGTPVNGTFVYVFDATTSAYIGAATMGSSGAYTIAVPAGSYKLYTQTNTSTYPDQWFGGSSFGAATPITVSAATPQDITLAGAPTFTLSGIVKTAGATPVEGTFVYVFDAGQNYIGPATMGSGGTYSIDVRAGTYKLYTQTNTPAYPDQWFGGSSIGSATSVTVSGATTQDITLTAASTFTLSGIVKSGGTPVNGTFVYVFDAGTSAYVGAATMGSGGSYTIDVPAGSYKLYTQTNTSTYPDQWFGGSSFASATAIGVSAATSQDITLTP